MEPLTKKTKILKDRGNLSREIKRYLLRFPNASTKKVCQELGLDYYRYRNLVYQCRHQLKIWESFKILGRALRSPCSHRVEWRVKGLPEELVKALWERARKDGKGETCQWYVIRNRNKMLHYYDEEIRINVFPKSGSCYILTNKPMSYQEIRKAFAHALALGVNRFDEESIRHFASFVEKIDVEVNSQHRVFYVGPVTPFKIEWYKPSLGLTIKSDGSHPEHIETIESYPAWVRELIAVNVKLIESLQTSLKAITDLIEQQQYKPPPSKTKYWG